MNYKVALVHDWLTSYYGSEKVLEAAAELFPDAPIYTLVCDPQALQATRLATRRIHTSKIDRLPRARQKYRSYVALMPFAIEQFDLGEFDLVISSCHAVAKGVITRADQLHISYVHSPMRYVWDLQFQYLGEAGLNSGVRGALARLVFHYLRWWDIAAANRVDVFAANSQTVARRIWKAYRRPATVIHPPVDVERFEPKEQREDFYLAVSRMVPYKRMDLVVDAFRQLGFPLVVIGDGPQADQVRRLAGPNIQWLGWQPDSVVKDYMERCKAFVFAANEDFGIAPVEAQASGAPVIAYGRGGVTETVIPGQTGIFFDQQNVSSLQDAVRSFESGNHRFDRQRIRRNAERFSRQRFQREFEAFVQKEWEAFRQGNFPAREEPSQQQTPPPPPS